MTFIPMTFIRVAVHLGVVLVAFASAGASATADPDFIIEKQVSQADHNSCQSYVLAIALAFKRDPAIPVKTWADLRILEGKLRAEVVKARDLRLPTVEEKKRLPTPADSTKAVEIVTDGRYTAVYKTKDLTTFGADIAQRTGVTTKLPIGTSFIIGGSVKDVVISSALKMGDMPYAHGHQFSILGVAGEANSAREYLVLNSANSKKAPVVQACQSDLPDDPGPYTASLSWRSDISWNLDGGKYRFLTIEKKH